MQFLSDWISNIILLILLATILELLLPNSSLQRYVKMVVGLLLLALLLNPIFLIISRDTDQWVEAIYVPTEIEENSVNFLVESKKKDIQSAQLAYISEQVAVQLKRQVEEEMMTKFHKQVKEIEVTIADLYQDNNLDHIINVTVHLQEAIGMNAITSTDSNSIQTVAIVSIDTKRTVLEKNLHHDDDSQEISRYLATEWKLPEEKISILVEGGNFRQ